MQLTRPAAVAGLFYPADKHQLQSMIHSYLDHTTPSGSLPKAIIAPHAGYVYSGPVAASAYARLRQGYGLISRVMLLGPSHRVGFRGLAVSSALWFATPLGEIPIDREACAKLAALPFVHELDQAHAQEHSLEVHLPFLQEVLGAFSLVPVVVGDAKPEEVATALETLWGGDETLIVISSDLSHYHDYATAKRMDAATSKAIEALRLEDIGYEDACGRLPVSGLLIAAKRRGMIAATLDLRNSGDTAGSKNRVVGYGAYAFEYPPKPADQKHSLDGEQQRYLLQLARDSIRHGLKAGQALPVDLSSLPAMLKTVRATFVTLQKHGDLRGCIGNLQAVRPLAEDIAGNAYAAAFQDPRFPPVQEAEVDSLDIHLSLLTPAEPMSFQSEGDLIAQLRPGVDGLILAEHGRRGTFLPSVWAQLPDPRQFLQHLKLKAGLPKDYWSDSIKIYRYAAEVVE